MNRATWRVAPDYFEGDRRLLVIEAHCPAGHDDSIGLVSRVGRKLSTSLVPAGRQHPGTGLSWYQASPRYLNGNTHHVHSYVDGAGVVHRSGVTYQVVRLPAVFTCPVCGTAVLVERPGSP